ncbi:MAG TPA: VWA domain-containing protein [Blastocatellia bacterium]|nr:VWA domain-containing protein [Blastocatellia bacterium]
MAFLNPLFLLGVAAAAIPILVHLVRKTRARKVEFASLMFLRRIEQKTVRKRKLRNLALLALRCLALLLLALAFARPYFPSQSSSASTGDRASVVILLDTSYSMRYSDVFESARAAARDAINGAGAGAQVAVVSFAQNSEVVMPLKVNPAEALASLNNLTPGLGSTDYMQAIQAAESILKESAGTARSVYLISDFQETGWDRAAPPAKLSPGIELVPVDVGQAKASNIAVTDVKADAVIYGQKYPGKIIARLNNFDRDRDVEAAVELRLNDLVVERRQVRIDPASARAVEFADFNVPDGSNRASVEITGDDFTLDNKYFFSVTREDQTKVLAIETATRGRSESFFIQQSLLAGENTRYELTVRTAGSTSPSDVDSYRVIIVNDVQGVSDSLASALKGFVERGGGLILVAGKHTEPADFERAFGGIAPAQLLEKSQVRGGYALMSQIKTDHPVFSLFARSGRLTSTKVYAYHRSEPRPDALTVAALDDGSPVMVERLAGGGKVLQLTTTLDTAWNDLPLTPLFLPFVRQMLEYLDGREGVSSYTIGQVFAARPDSGGALPLVEGPGGNRVEDARKTPSGELSINASEAGFYSLRYPTAQEHVAVNLDTRDSDLTRLDVNEFVAAVLPDGAGQSARPAPSEKMGPEEIEGRQRLWLPLLITALILFIAEALIARRIRVAKMAG